MDAAHQQQFDEMLKTQQEKTEQEKQAIKVRQPFDSCLYDLSSMIHAPGDIFKVCPFITSPEIDWNRLHYCLFQIKCVPLPKRCQLCVMLNINIHSHLHKLV